MSYGFDEIFVREKALIGNSGLSKLRAAKVAVCGLGGVGSYLAEALARSAVGHLLLIDFDQVAASNINRQLCALQSTVGQDKADVVAARIADINSECVVQCRKIFLSAETDYQELFSGLDYIADAIDHVPAKLAMIEYAYQHNQRIISAMGAGRRLDPTELRISDIAKTHGCPLAKSIRKQLRERGIEQGIKVVFSPEPALPVEGEIGSMAFVPAVAGLLMASEIVQDILD